MVSKAVLRQVGRAILFLLLLPFKAVYFVLLALGIAILLFAVWLYNLVIDDDLLKD